MTNRRSHRPNRTKRKSIQFFLRPVRSQVMPSICYLYVNYAIRIKEPPNNFTSLFNLHRETRLKNLLSSDIGSLRNRHFTIIKIPGLIVIFLFPSPVSLRCGVATRFESCTRKCIFTKYLLTYGMYACVRKWVKYMNIVWTRYNLWRRCFITSIYRVYDTTRKIYVNVYVRRRSSEYQM